MLFSGTCCVYRSAVTAIDMRGNMKTWPVDFSGGKTFNTTVENFDRLVKSVDKASKPYTTQVEQSTLYNTIQDCSEIYWYSQ